MFTIRTASGKLLSSENGHVFLFPSERSARKWLMPGDLIEPTDLKPRSPPWAAPGVG